MNSSLDLIKKNKDNIHFDSKIKIMKNDQQKGTDLVEPISFVLDNLDGASRTTFYDVTKERIFQDFEIIFWLF